MYIKQNSAVPAPFGEPYVDESLLAEELNISAAKLTFIVE